MLYRDLECEKYWDLPSTDKRKNEKINGAIQSEKYIASIKKDGEYIRAIYDEDGEVWLLGRGTNSKSVHNLNNHLPFITKWLTENFEKGTCIIGELYVPGETSNAIRKYTGSLVPRSLKEQEKCPPKYYIHDVWAINGANLLNVRYATRTIYVQALPTTKQIETAAYVKGSDDIINYISKAFAANEEGCVLVNEDAVVNPGKRTAWKTIKVKKSFQTDIDVFFTGKSRSPERLYTGKEIEIWNYWENIHTNEKLYGILFADYVCGRPFEPVTKPYYYGWPASLEIACVDNTKEIISLGYVSSGLTDQIREEFTSNPESFCKRPALVQGMEFTVDGLIRHPKFVRFRDDINWTDCEIGKIV